VLNNKRAVYKTFTTLLAPARNLSHPVSKLVGITGCLMQRGKTLRI